MLDSYHQNAALQQDYSWGEISPAHSHIKHLLSPWEARELLVLPQRSVLLGREQGRERDSKSMEQRSKSIV